MTKTCCFCEQNKPVTEFVRNNATKGGYTSRCKICLHAWRKEYYKRRKAVFKARSKRWHDANKGKTRERTIARRVAVLNHYSGGTMACACCGIAEYEFLTIDHIVSVGHRGRKALGHDGSGVYRRLLDSGFPPGYRVLCFNCNCARGYRGICPHEVKNVIGNHAESRA